MWPWNFGGSSLGSLTGPSSKKKEKEKREAISRLKKSDLASGILKELEMKIYDGEKKPSMPDLFAKKGVPP